MLKKLILIIISCFLIACSSTDNQTKYIDRKALREKEVVETVQNQEENSSYNSVFEDVAIQVVSDMLDLGLKLLISTVVPVN